MAAAVPPPHAAAAVDEGRIYATLRDTFGLQEFRPPQLDVIKHVLGGGSGLVLLPTGGGKSLCYQLPAILLPGVTIVISPLLALMDDQVSALRSKGVEARHICSLNTPSINRAGLADLDTPQPRVKLLYVTPERLGQDEFLALLKRLHGRGLLAALVCDEAHCISSWGVDFRPAFRAMGKVRDALPAVPCLSLTATATTSVQRDILEQLRIPPMNVFTSSFDRPAIWYGVEYKPLLNDAFGLLANLIKKHIGSSGAASGAAAAAAAGAGSSIPSYFQKKPPQPPPSVADNPATLPAKGGGGGRRGGRALVYAWRVADVELLAQELTSRGLPTLAYHSKLGDSKRQQVQAQFVHGEVKCVTATLAFGMGIDVADVRVVAHWNLPSNLEAFYQESGRAGRDGKSAVSVLFYDRQDVKARQFVMAREEEGGGGGGGGGGGMNAKRNLERKEEQLEKVVEYCEAAEECRRKVLLRHFGEKVNQRPAGWSKNTCCDYCVDGGNDVRGRLRHMLQGRRGGGGGMGRYSQEEEEEDDEYGGGGWGSKKKSRRERAREEEDEDEDEEEVDDPEDPEVEAAIAVAQSSQLKKRLQAAQKPGTSHQDQVRAVLKAYVREEEKGGGGGKPGAAAPPSRRVAPAALALAPGAAPRTKKALPPMLITTGSRLKLGGSSSASSFSAKPLPPTPKEDALARFEALDEDKESSEKLGVSVERRRKVIKEIYSLSTEGLVGREADKALEAIKEQELEWFSDASDKAAYQASVRNRLESLYQ